MLYTKKGDDGSSGLFGTDQRFTKDSAIYDALGTLDELNSLLGMCRAQMTNTNLEETDEITNHTLKAQEAVFIIQAELAGSDHTIDPLQVTELEQTIDDIERLVGNPHSFIIPGATILSAWFDIARTVARRAERLVIKVQPDRKVSAGSKAYLNRLSSLLYALARYVASLEHKGETAPLYQ